MKRLRREAGGFSARLVGCLAALLVSCSNGDDAPSSLEPVASSAQDPDSGFGEGLTHSSAVLDLVVYVSVSNQDVLNCTERDGDYDQLSLGGFYPQLMFVPWSPAPEDELWILGGDGNGQVALRVYTDDDGDGLIDPSTATVLFTGQRPDVVRLAAYDPGSGTLYLQELGTSHIYRARDTNADLRPDTLDQTPFADGSWMGPGNAPRVFVETDPETGEEQEIPAGLASYAARLKNAESDRVTVAAIAVFVDTNADGVADDLIDYLSSAKGPPSVLGGRLVAGMHEVEVIGSFDADVELREVDAQGNVLQVLGSVHLVGGHGILFLASELDAAVRVALRDITNNIDGHTHIVGAEKLYLGQPAAVVIQTGEAVTLTLDGANLDRVTSVTLSSSEAEGPADLALTFATAADGRSITVDVTSLADAWDGHAMLRFDGEEEEEEEEPERAVVAADVCKGQGGGSSGG